MSSNVKLARKTGFLGASKKRGAFPIRQNLQPRDKVVKSHGNNFTQSIASPGSGIHNCQEESLQLVPNSSGTNVPFAMMIRLTPEILEQLKQASTNNISPQMKFGTNANGNVIQIGNQNFKFSSAPEPGDLCDIYAGQSGQSMLTESGSVWHKLSVLRTLNDNEMFRVKKRTAEAEKMQKNRKSILVDSSTQIVVPQDTPAEVNNTKNFSKTKKDPPLKRLKTSSSPEPKPTAPLYGTSVDNCHISPPPSRSPEVVHHSKNDTFAGGSLESSVSKQDWIEKEKLQTGSLSVGVEDGKTGPKVNMANLRNFLITILEENPKGMTLKKLIEKVEKNVAEGMSFCLDKKLIEKVIKSIASYHAPGKYLLIPGVQRDMSVETTVNNIVKSSEEIRTVKVKSSTTLNTSIIQEKETDIDMKNALPHQVCNENVPPQRLDCELNDVQVTPQETPKQKVSGKEGVTSEDSELSSSSESGSDSGSDSDTSDTGSGSTASNSRSGSDSDSSSTSSSSSTSLDEDMEVDIMSDDANEIQYGTKAPEMQPIIKEDNIAIEDVKRDPSNSLQMENIIESVFGSDDVDVVGGDHISPLHTSPMQSTLSTDIKRGSPLPSLTTMTQGRMGLSHNKDQRKGNNFDLNIKSSDAGYRATKGTRELDILVDRICDKETQADFYAKEMKKSPLAIHDAGKSVKTLRSEPKAVAVKKKDAILDAREVKGEKTTERSQKIGRPVNHNTVKQVRTKQALSSVSKKTRGTEITGKHDIDGAKCKKQKFSKPGEGTLGACEGVKVNHNIAKDDSVLSKEGIAESKLPKPVERKPVKELGLQQLVKKSGSENKGNPLRRTKGPVKVHRTAAVSKDSQKDNDRDLVGRANPIEEKSEKSLKVFDTSKREKSIDSKKILKGTGKVPLNITGSVNPSSQVTTGGPPFDECTHGQNNPPKCDRMPSYDLELGEFREPPSENDHARVFGSSDVQIRSNQASDTTSKASSRKWSVSPDAERPQHLMPCLYDIADQSSPNLANDRTHTTRKIIQSKFDKGLSVRKKTRSSSSDAHVPAMGLHKYENGEKIASSKSIGDTKGASVHRVHSKERKYKVSKHLQSSYKHTSQSSEVQDSEMYSEYDKKNPELRGPINSFEQLKDYYKEFNQKYPIYVQLNKCIESAREDFEIYQKHIEQAMSKGDKDKLGNLYMKVKKEYCLCHKKYKRMKHAFNVLHMELQVIKQHCQDYAQKFEKY